GEALAHPRAHRLVPMMKAPAAMPEAAGRVLLRAARRLHDSVEADEAGDDHPPHRASSAATSPSWSAQVPQPSWKPIFAWVSASAGFRCIATARYSVLPLPASASVMIAVKASPP